MAKQVLLNALFDAGNKVGVIMAWVTVFLLTIELVYVMYKYVFAKNKD